MIFVCGDVHGEYDIDKLYYLQKLDVHLKLSRKDYLIIAGDFGGIWGRNTPNTDEKLIKGYMKILFRGRLYGSMETMKTLIKLRAIL